MGVHVDLHSRAGRDILKPPNGQLSTMLYIVFSAIWFVLTVLVGTIMWASQVGPHQAVSNLSLWAQKFGIENPPEWLKAKSADRLWRRRAAFSFAALLLIGGFMGGIAFSDYLRPIPEPRLPPTNRWQPLSSQETTALREDWRSFSPQRLGVLCAIPACADLAESIYDVAQGLNWPAIYASTYFMDHDIQAGIEIWSYPEKAADRDKIASSIEHATQGRLRISSQAWPKSEAPLLPDTANGINLVIGRPK
jgi:hypothetical protein